MSATPRPLGRLKYLYLGSSRFEADLAYYRDTLGAEVVWAFEKFGAKVAAFRAAEGPLLILADHRPAPSCLPIFAVPDVEATAGELRARGWAPARGPVEIPDGPCYVFQDPSGNEPAVFGELRPDALVGAYADPRNKAALR
jgi:predicted enzyme related to lactoylglutathione lyase